MQEKERIYLDHAASTPLDGDVLKEMLPLFTAQFGNANSQHYFGRSAMSALDKARTSIARLINAEDNEVFFTSGGTEADNFAVFGAARAQKKLGRKKIFISSIEHHAVLTPVEKLADDEGFETHLIPVDRYGRIDLDYLEQNVDETTAFVGVMYASNELGTIQPVKEAAKIAHKHGALFFTDAVQAAPYVKLNVKELDADILTFSAHKFYGPKGTGILYVKKGTPLERLIIGGEQEQGFRAGTVNVAGAVGAAAAYEKTMRELSEANEKILEAKDAFLREIASVPFIHVNGGVRRAVVDSVADGAASGGVNGEEAVEYVPSVLNLRIDGVKNVTMLSLMDLNGVAASAGSACVGGDIQPSYVLLSAGFTMEQARSSFRVSFGKHNTREEAVRAAKIIVEIADKLRKNQ